MNGTRRSTLVTLLLVSGWVLVVVYAIGLVSEGVGNKNWGARVLLVVSIVALVVGLLILRRGVSGVALGLVAVGSVPGAFAMVWTVIAPLLTILIIALVVSIAVKRRNAELTNPG
jgi:hypothetical protein